MIRDLLEIAKFVFSIGSIPYVYAPFLGLLLGLVFTQFTKWALPKNISRRPIQALAIFLTFIVIVFLIQDWIGVVIAAIFGMLCPMLYQTIVWRLYKRWPKLERILSNDCPSD